MVFSDRALEFLREDDEATYSAITPHMESWNDITIVHRGERVTIDGVGFSAIGRLKLLQLLQARARSVGVEPVYRRMVKSLDELGDADLIVGADGVNSLVRRGNEERFGASVRLLYKSLCLVRHRQGVLRRSPRRLSKLTPVLSTRIITAMRRISARSLSRSIEPLSRARASRRWTRNETRSLCANACLRRRWMATR